MKLKWMAVAAMAAAGGMAHADSSVTLYGVLDVSVGRTTGGQVAINGGRGNAASAQSYHTPSRIGFKGTEDMGGGLAANFGLETGGISLVDGGPGLSFTREAWVGLSGGFGATRFGLTSSVATQGHARFDLNGISGSSAMANAGVSPVTWYSSSRRPSQIQYVTPNMGGADVGLGYVLAGNNEDQASLQVRVNYGTGPFAVGYVAETKRVAGNRTAQAIAGSYDFQVAKLVAGYVVRESEALGKGAYVGASAPFGPVTVGLQHARNTGTEADATELFANYAMSKRTKVYLDYVKKGGSASGYSYALGLLHSF
ncbi:porin [Hydrogenophaga sp. 5NK40-0174]|uniref:porin n=1 Tax=Hydrogenophaga sp. 5NK40-0174 TaxID=3127649 RepID=UPI003108C858